MAPKRRVRSKKQQFFFKKPYGPSKVFSIGNTAHSTDGPILCGLCGSRFPLRRDESYRTFSLFGKWGVLECCGKIMDELFYEWSDTFEEEVFTRFRESPLDDRFYMLRHRMTNAAPAWIQAAGKMAEEAQLVVGAAQG